MARTIKTMREGCGARGSWSCACVVRGRVSGAVWWAASWSRGGTGGGGRDAPRKDMRYDLSRELASAARVVPEVVCCVRGVCSADGWEGHATAQGGRVGWASTCACKVPLAQQTYRSQRGLFVTARTVYCEEMGRSRDGARERGAFAATVAGGRAFGRPRVRGVA